MLEYESFTRIFSYPYSTIFDTIRVCRCVDDVLTALYLSVMLCVVRCGCIVICAYCVYYVTYEHVVMMHNVMMYDTM